MTDKTAGIIVRPARQSDLEALCTLLNQIIEIGGTTAIEEPLSESDFDAYFLTGADHIACLVAENGAGAVLGFQALERHRALPADWADIATFARLKPKTPGVGSALFKETLALAKRQGLVAINATIRADNAGGLAYYAKMGFEDYAVAQAVPLRDGRPVDRISKKYVIR